MSAELLRRAAATLREHAEAATRGPWTLTSDTYPQEINNERAEFVAQCLEGPQHPPATAKYIALMHPPVALALADWLDKFGDICDWPSPVDEVWPDAENAIAVARAILREAAS